jgi:chemotaxis signal transduction protein
MSGFDTPEIRLEAALSYVLFPIGSKRFALPSDIVSELARPGRLQSFPHTTPHLAGVLLRRGQIVPVCDIARILSGCESRQQRFHLIAERKIEGGAREWVALPVDGECELSNVPILPPTGKLPAYVQGLLSLPNEIVEVLDLEKVITMESKR